MSLSERWIDGVNAISSPWGDMMLRACWQGGLALLAAWGICGFLAKRAGGAGWAQCWFWRIGYGKFLLCVACLPALSLPLLPSRAEMRDAPRPMVAAAPRTMAEARLPAAAAESHATIADEAMPASGRDLLPVEAATEAVEVGSVVPAAASGRIAALSMGSWLLILWLLGVIACMARVGMAWRRTAALARGAEAVGQERVLAVYRQIAGRMGIGRVPQVLWSEKVSSPLLIGLWRPAIVLPETMAECRREHLELVFAHELAHLRRWDVGWNLLQAAVQVLFFFHPLVWLTRRPWILAQELACDEWALRATGARPAELGRVLLAVVTQEKAARQRLLGVGVAESGGTVRRRLLAMKNGMGWSRKRAVMVAVVAGIAGAVGLVPWRVVAQVPTGQVVTREDPPLPAGSADDIAARMNARRAAQVANGQPGNVGMAQGNGPAVDKRSTPVMTGADPSKIENSDKWVTQIIPLKYADAVRLRNDLAPMFSAEATVTTNASSNSIVITDTSAHVRQLAEIIKSLDQQAEARGSTAPPKGGAALGTASAAAAPGKPGEITAIGQLSSPVDEIRPKVDGTIEGVGVKDGQSVKTGDVLFKLDSRAAQVELELAQVRMQMAQAKYDQLEAAAKMATVPMSEAAQAKAEVEMNKVALDGKKLELDALTIRAPSDGVVVLDQVRPGQFVSKGSRLAKVVNVQDLTLTMQVAYPGGANVHVGQKLTFTANGGRADEQGNAEVVFVSPIVDSATGTVTVRAQVAGDNKNLKPGTIVTAKLAAN